MDNFAHPLTYFYFFATPSHTLSISGSLPIIFLGNPPPHIFSADPSPHIFIFDFHSACPVRISIGIALKSQIHHKLSRTLIQVQLKSISLQLLRTEMKMTHVLEMDFPVGMVRTILLLWSLSEIGRSGLSSCCGCCFCLLGCDGFCRLHKLCGFR